MDFKKDRTAIAKLMALKCIGEEFINLLNEKEVKDFIFGFDSIHPEELKKELLKLKNKIDELEKENEELKKSIQEYKVLLNCLELENYNPTKFQKGDNDEDDSINGFSSNYN